MSFKTFAAPFALLCKLCSAPDGDSDPDWPEEPQPIADAAVTRDAAADAAIAHDASIRSDAAASDRDADAGVPISDASAPSAAEGGQVNSGDSGTAAPDAEPAAPICPPGLFRDDKCTQLSPSVRAYEPRFALWSDGTTKERYIELPAGAVIDATEDDSWVFPVGTRLYKTFARDGMKLETRIMEKTTAGRGVDTWSFRAYAWNKEQTGTVLVEETGRQNVLGTTHDIPSLAQCRSCHSAAGQDGSNGFSAIQLNHLKVGTNLTGLIAQGKVKTPHGQQLRDLAVVPGDDVIQDGLGVLHANCGHCHGGPNPRAQLKLRLSVGQTVLLATDIFKSTVNVPLGVWTGRTRSDGVPYMLRASPGDAALSAIVARMSTRGSKDQMPPIGTEFVDEAGLSAVKAMVAELPSGDLDL